MTHRAHLLTCCAHRPHVVLILCLQDLDYIHRKTNIPAILHMHTFLYTYAGSAPVPRRIEKTHIPRSSVGSFQNKIHLCSFQRPFAVDVGSCPVLSGSLGHEVHSPCVFQGYQSVDGVRAGNALYGSYGGGSCVVRTWLYALAANEQTFASSDREFDRTPGK